MIKLLKRLRSLIVMEHELSVMKDDLYQDLMGGIINWREVAKVDKSLGIRMYQEIYHCDLESATRVVTDRLVFDARQPESNNT